MRVAVVGAGIGGVAAALFLRRQGIEVDVYEQAPALTEVGAGIQLGPNGAKLLHRVGLEARLREVAVQPQTAWNFRRWQDGRVLFSQELGARAMEQFGAPYYVIHRADLLDALASQVPREMIHLGQRCVDVRQDDDGVELTFASGLKVRADVVIGADGIHSVIRDKIVQPTPPTFSKLCAYRGLVPIEKTPVAGQPPSVTIWLGPHRHFVHYPVSGGRLLNIVAVVPSEEWAVESWSADGRVEDLQAEFEGWHPQLAGIIGALESVKRWALYDREPLAKWTFGRITLLGDAAHPMLPFFAQGAVQAIEDAAVLAACLKHADAHSAPEALERYEAVRRPRAVRVQQLSRMRGKEYHLPDGPEQERRDRELAESDRLRTYAWHCAHDGEREVDAAA
ncbi:MAG: FAD-dependent monooxygenase [Limnochordales bacterium]